MAEITGPDNNVPAIGIHNHSSKQHPTPPISKLPPTKKRKRKRKKRKGTMTDLTPTLNAILLERQSPAIPIKTYNKASPADEFLKEAYRIVCYTFSDRIYPNFNCNSNSSLTQNHNANPN